MNKFNTIVPLNCLGVNVRFTKAFIEQYEKQLSQLQSSKDGLIQSRTAKELNLRSFAKAQRDELLRKIAETDKWEKSQLEQLTTAYNTAQAPYDQRINFLKTQITAAKEAIAPIRTLPAELLGNVFCEFVGLDQPPCVLILVSKSWKQTALTTPWLWRHLLVGGPTKASRFSPPRRSWRVGGRKCYTTGNKLICGSVEDLQMWVDKSGRVPLQVELRDPQPGQADELMRDILGEQLSFRIQSLSISLSTSKLNVTDLNIGQFPLLSNFSIKSLYDEAARPLITSILTRSCRIDEFTSCSPLLDFLPEHRFWNSIRVLSLGGGPQSIQFNEVIGALTVVETILGSPDNWPDITTPTRTLEHVKHLSVRCQPEFLARLQLPLLETLDLRDPDCWSRPSTNTTPVVGQLNRPWQLSMPNLVKLTIGSKDATWLPRLFVPDLKTMSWNGEGSHPAAQTAFPQIQFSNVETFTFDAECSDEILRSAINCVPNVKDLTLGPGEEGHRCNKMWALDFLRHLKGGNDFPKLRRLTLGISYHWVGTNKSLAKPLIKNVIKWRKQIRLPFEHFEVTWLRRSYNRETIQYVN